jgi:hypothetical protein
MRKIFTLTLFALTLIFLGGNLTSCDKNEDTLARITVLDANGLPVSGALVNVIGRGSDGEDGGRIDMESTTGSDGVATFNFNELFKRGQAGFAVLDIEVQKDAMIGTGIIKVEENITNESTVSIQ